MNTTAALHLRIPIWGGDALSYFDRMLESSVRTSIVIHEAQDKNLFAAVGPCTDGDYISFAHCNLLLIPIPKTAPTNSAATIVIAICIFSSSFPKSRPRCSPEHAPILNTQNRLGELYT